MTSSAKTLWIKLTLAILLGAALVAINATWGKDLPLRLISN